MATIAIDDLNRVAGGFGIPRSCHEAQVEQVQANARLERFQASHPHWSNYLPLAWNTRLRRSLEVSHATRWATYLCRK